MSAPQTGRISVPRPARSPALRGSARGLATAVVRGTTRTPEVTVGALGLLLAVAFAWVPSPWYDEAATVTSATRTWPQLWAELHHVDAVHGLYYACMHVWFRVVGYTPFTLRVPSALAIGLAAALVVALARRLGGRRLGIVAGLVFLVLPRVQWAGVEGRPYATITTLSVGLSLVGLTAVRRTRLGAGRRWWAVYAGLAIVAVVFNVYLSLVVVAHGVVLAWTAVADRRARRRATTDRGASPLPLVPRTVVRRWVVAAVAAGVVVAPFAAVVVAQAKQVSWIAPVGQATLGQVGGTAWFGGSGLVATVGWTAMAVGAVLPLVAARRRRGGGTAREAVRAQAVRVALPVALLPTLLLLGATALGEHLYSPKYASMSLPAVAIVIALALTAIRPRLGLFVALAALVAVAVPPDVQVKTPFDKQDSHWAQAAAIVQQQRTLDPDADEGVVYGSVWKHPITTAQVVRDTYPAAFAGMTDLATVTWGPETGQLWDTNGDVRSTVPARLGHIDTVWYVGANPRSIEPALRATLRREGFRTVARWTTGPVVVAEYERGAG